MTALFLFINITHTDDAWLNQQAIPKRGTPEIYQTTDNSRKNVVASIDRWRLRVIGEKGDWVMVQVRNSKGWIEKKQLVRVNEGIAYFTGRINDNDEIAEAYSKRAFLSELKGDFDSAFNDAEKAISHEPTASGYNTRGRIWATRNEYDKAIRDFNESIRIDPRNEVAFYNRGVSWKAIKQFEKAIEDYSEAIRLDPTFINALNNRGLLWGKKKEYDKAIHDFSEIINYDPNNALAFYCRGNNWVDKKEYDKAIQDYTDAIRLDPQDKYAFFSRAFAWDQKNEIGKAIQDLSEVIRIDPKHVNATDQLARILATSTEAKYRDGKRAVELAKKVCDLTDWKDPYRLDTLSRAYATSGEFELAIKYQKQALTFPDYEKEAREVAGFMLKRYEAKKPPYRE